MLDKEQSFDFRKGMWGDFRFGSHVVTEVGLIDNIREQESQKASLDLCSGNTIIYGNVSAGKTTLMYTIIANIIKSYSPKLVNIFIINFGEMGYCEFSGMPHVSAVINPNYEDDNYLFSRCVAVLKWKQKYTAVMR